MFLDISVGRVLFKFYQGTRADLEKNIPKFVSKEEEEDHRKKYFLYKNPSSVGLIKIKNVIYHFFMRENGAKTMKLYVGSLNLNDFREGSKLTKNKKIIFNFDK